MKFQVVTLFPELIQAGAFAGVLGQALKKNLLTIDVIQPRDFAEGVHRAVDDRPFGGGDGMIMMPDILERCVEKARSTGPTRVVYLSPQGAKLTDAKVRDLAKGSSLTLVCGRYGGVDQRALNLFVDEELSIGDYVLSGGELAALVVIDSVARMIPGVLGHQESAHQDSFSEGHLEHPNFTRPREWRGQTVPEALLSGNHVRIAEWKKTLGWLVTLKKRPELLEGLSAEDWGRLWKAWEKIPPAERETCGIADLKPEDFRGLRPR